MQEGVVKIRLLNALNENYTYYYSLVYSIVKSHSDVEDVFQDIRCRVLSYKLPEEIQNIRAYLTVMAKNAAYDHVKKMPSYVFIEDINPVELSYTDEHIFDVLFEAGMEVCMSRIPEKVRPALIEHLCSGESLSALCKKYDLTRKTLRYWKKLFLNCAKNILD